MDVFILGAGKPAHGEKPSSLKTIAQSTRAMDWLIHCFELLNGVNNLHFLGGYHVEDVVKDYPNLKFTVIPDWERRSILHTFLNAPFTSNSAIITYSDTIFRKEILEKMLAVDADVVVGIDQEWRSRYNRDLLDIKLAETIDFLDIKSGSEVEFTGLVYFNAKTISYIRSLSEEDIGHNLIDLLHYLKKQGFNILPFDLSRNWAEFNSPKDIAKFILGTKADTLKRLESRVSTCKIGNQVCFTLHDWLSDSSKVLNSIVTVFSGTSIIVRSSSKNEDSWTSSNAGEYQSILNVDANDSKAISEAIDKVIISYGNHADEEEQVLVQQCISNVAISGVVFTCNLDTGAPYYRFNFDDKSSSTESVTSGNSLSLRTIILSRFKTDLLATKEPKLIPVLRAVQELEELLQFDKLDIEFAVDWDGCVHVFQVRPITVDHSNFEVEQSEIENNLFDSQKFLFRKNGSISFCVWRGNNFCKYA
ncbi:PEP/pyruvate-binding domain-containing protein [Legionella tunisiensis]|uniref:PEP/pyruvate-binding domain-containing protein n=1 Tax=Legionella tunisiensis TaxID=1034944 RepID=UPI000302C0A9|nr:PEP/pyruvate-binding domain-containing protein [Legionella tunisiensis]